VEVDGLRPYGALALRGRLRLLREEPAFSIYNYVPLVQEGIPLFRGDQSFLLGREGFDVEAKSPCGFHRLQSMDPVPYHLTELRVDNVTSVCTGDLWIL